MHLTIDGALEKADLTSDQGDQRGHGLASANFCMTIHPGSCQLDAELAPGGGSAHFDIDDAYTMVPPRMSAVCVASAATGP